MMLVRVSHQERPVTVGVTKERHHHRGEKLTSLFLGHGCGTCYLVDTVINHWAGNASRKSAGNRGQENQACLENVTAKVIRSILQMDKHMGEKKGGRECTGRACGDREQAAMPEGTPSVPCGPGTVPGTCHQQQEEAKEKKN